MLKVVEKKTCQYLETGRQFKKPNLDPDLSFRKGNHHFVLPPYFLHLTAFCSWHETLWQLPPFNLTLLCPCQKVKLFIYQVTHLCLIQVHKEMSSRTDIRAWATRKDKNSTLLIIGRLCFLPPSTKKKLLSGSIFAFSLSIQLADQKLNQSSLLTK